MFLKVIFDEWVKFFSNIIKHTHNEGYVYIFISFLLVIFGFFVSSILGFILIIVSMWCVYFFRDPERIINHDENLLCSPADGTIVNIIESITPPSDMGIDEEMQKISIFLSIFNVHVNRTPIAGTVEQIIYHEGQFLNAGVDKASEANERNTIVLATKHGKVAVAQIAGLIARRIICQVSTGKTLEAGEKYGIIKFGSRVDVYFPKSFKIKVKLWQTMVGGETIMAEVGGETIMAEGENE